MRLLLFLTLILLVTLTRGEWELVWSDEFDGSEIDSSKWVHEITMSGGGNNEFQVYADDPLNAYVADGKLFIQPTLFEEMTNPQTGQPYGPDFRANGETLNLYDNYGRCDTTYNNGCERTGLDIPPTGSVRLRTKGVYPFRYGRVEISASMPVGDWLWPALWLLPENDCYGNWPASGEIDMCEIIGNEDFRWGDGSPSGMQHMGSTMHWGVSPEDNRFYLTTQGRTDEGWTYGRNFHTYALEWTNNGLSFFVDDVRLLDVPSPLIDQNPGWAGFFEYGKPWYSIDENDPSQNPWLVNNDQLMVPFDTQFHFIFNVAVGGTTGMISDDAINRGGDPYYAKPWHNSESQYDAMNNFYNALDAWKWTWDKEGELSAMQVDYIRVYKDESIHPPEQDPDCPN